MKRLSKDTLSTLPERVTVPRYRRENVGVGIVHLGLGAFHRAHQAFYTDKVLAEKGGDWAIIGASLRSGKVREQLCPQDGLYTLVEKSNDAQAYYVIDSIKDVVLAADDPARLITLLADERIKIISLTITEKGYHFSSQYQGLDVDDPAVQNDLRCYEQSPVTAIGYIVAALAVRKREGRGGVTLLSCDNLSHNGKVLQQVVMDFVDAVNPELSSWVDNNVRFPCSMVDRIVPAPTDEEIEALADTLGVVDRAAVFTEPFCQWIIEDNFISGRPEWECAGALLVGDVTPFEKAKLRLLNGSHSLIAYLGHNADYDYVHQVMADENFRRLIEHYMDEVLPGLELPPTFDVAGYRQQLLDRFSNRALNHKVAQIAEDGSKKVAQRWFATIGNDSCRQLNAHALAFAGWIYFLGGVKDTGKRYSLKDPMAVPLQQLVHEQRADVVEAILGLLGLDAAARKHATFIDTARSYLHALQRNGVKQTLVEFLNT